MQKAQREGEKARVLLSIAFRGGEQTSSSSTVIRQTRLIILQVVKAPEFIPQKCHRPFIFPHK